MNKPKFNKKRTLLVAMDWVKTLEEYASTRYLPQKLAANGIQVEEVLKGMTAEQLKVVSCLMASCNTKGHEDQRKWKREYMLCDQSAEKRTG